MDDIQTIVGLFTFGGVALTIAKTYYKKTSWYWNLAPMLVGFVSCLWLAKIVS
jgi:hypothetical protein